MPLFRRVRHTLTFAIDINLPNAAVFEHLSNPRNSLGLQPLLINISDINEATEDGIVVRRYTTTEKFIFLGFFTYHNRIHVTIRLTQPSVRLDMHVESPGGVTLDVEYQFSTKGHGTHIQEIVHVQSLPFTTKFVLNEATKAQSAMLARLKARLESQVE